LGSSRIEKEQELILFIITDVVPKRNAACADPCKSPGKKSVLYREILKEKKRARKEQYLGGK
jgi:hypothetical protein